jgi:type VII secretion effector (TIGR04197 family)
MSQEIKLYKDAYDEAVNAIRDASSRTSENNANFGGSKTTARKYIHDKAGYITLKSNNINKSKGTVFLQYLNTISELQKLLDEYNSVLATDVEKLYSLGADLEKSDKQLSMEKEKRFQAYRIRG